jgi:putative membrane protein
VFELKGEAMRNQILVLAGAMLLAGCSQTNQSGYTGAADDHFKRGAWTDSANSPGMRPRPLSGAGPLEMDRPAGTDSRGASSDAGSTSTKGAAARTLTGANEMNTSVLDISDVAFLREAAQAGHAEVRMGEILSEKASDPSLREFGRMLLEHHGQGNAELASLATRKGLSAPEEMSPAQQAKMAQLADLSGDRLDRAMEKQALDSHVRALRSYKMAARQARDADVRAFAKSQIPLLEEHLNTVRRLAQDSLGTRTGTGMGGANDSY